jgi:hypothetical protein
VQNLINVDVCVCGHYGLKCEMVGGITAALDGTVQMNVRYYGRDNVSPKGCVSMCEGNSYLFSLLIAYTVS